MFEAERDKAEGKVWEAFQNTIAKITDKEAPEVLAQKVLNEARTKHFSQGSTDAAFWLNGHDAPQTLPYDALGNPITSSKALGENIQIVYGYDKIPGTQPHHIVPRGDTYATDLRAILKRHNIHPDDAANGTFMTTSNVNKHYGVDKEWIDGLGPDHKKHTHAYVDKVRNDIRRFADLPASPQNTMLLKNELQKIADKLIRGDYPW